MKVQGESDRTFGLAVMIFFGFMELAMCLFLLLYLLPKTDGIWLFLTLNGIFFFGCGAIFFFVYCAPARPLINYRRSDGSYLILRPRLINVVQGAILIYAAVMLPVVALFLVIMIPWALLSNPQEVLPVLGHFSLWNLYQAFDNAQGLVFVLIPLLIAFPWLYPRFLRLARRALASMFSDVGIKLDAHGLSVLGGEAGFIPWSWVTHVDAAIHGNTDTVVLKGSPELMRFRGKLDRRLPKEIREAAEWKGEGVPMKLEFLRIRASELAETISVEFLSRR